MVGNKSNNANVFIKMNRLWLWILFYSPGAPQSAHKLLPGCRTKSSRILLFLSRLAIGEGSIAFVRLTVESQQKSY